jgi:hypothetical protein
MCQWNGMNVTHYDPNAHTSSATLIYTPGSCPPTENQECQILYFVDKKILLAKKGTKLLNKQTPLNFETIKKLIKQKLKKSSPKKPLHHPAKHSGKTSNLHGKTTKTNPENKKWRISDSTQVTTALQHTSIASKYSVIITAQYAK